MDLGGSILTGISIGIPAIFLKYYEGFAHQSIAALSLITGAVLGLLVGSVIGSIRKFTSNQANSTFGTDVMIGAEDSSGRFLGPLIVLSACGASRFRWDRPTLGSLGFYAWKKQTYSWRCDSWGDGTLYDLPGCIAVEEGQRMFDSLVKKGKHINEGGEKSVSNQKMV